MKLTPDVPQFFFDDSVIAHSQRLTRRWLPAKVYPEPLLRPDKPWEGHCISLYGTVLPDPDGGWRMYYGNFNPTFTFKKHDEKVAVAPGMLLAHSDDGITWHKPELGQVEWKGQSTNFIAHSGRHLDGAPVMYDPEDAERPYKMIGFSYSNIEPMWNETFGLYTRYSKDGIHWSPQAQRPALRAGDRTNLMATRWQGKYLLHSRACPEASTYNGGRAIWRFESDDFEHWSQPEMVLIMDLQDEPDVEYYGLTAFERHGWMMGLLEYWCSATDTLQLHLAVSRDGRRWIRPAVRQPFIPNCYDWNRKWVTCATNGPIMVGGQMVFYFGGRWTSHHFDSLHLHGVIGAASVPIDRFCAIEGGSSPVGYLDTVPLEWPGGDLALNADTRSNFETHPWHCDGCIMVDVLDAEGAPLPDWSGERAATFRGNTHCRGRVDPGVVNWPAGRSLDALRGQTIRLRFRFQHSRLYTFAARTGAG